MNDEELRKEEENALEPQEEAAEDKERKEKDHEEEIQKAILRKAMHLDLEFCQTVADFFITSLMLRKCNVSTALVEKEYEVDALLREVAMPYSKLGREQAVEVDNWFNAYQRQKVLAKGGELKKQFDFQEAISKISTMLTEEQKNAMSEQGIDLGEIDRIFGSSKKAEEQDVNVVTDVEPKNVG